MQAYNLSFGRLEEEDLKFKAILSYVAVLASQTKQKQPPVSVWILWNIWSGQTVQRFAARKEERWKYESDCLA